jgi:hypothetical protein
MVEPMSKVFLTIPSARPDGGTAHTWAAAGYGVALWRDSAEPLVRCADIAIVGQYPGYAKAVNSLAKMVFAADPECDWIVAAGDDTTPDPDHLPWEIARQITAQFGNPYVMFHGSAPDRIVHPTFGVVQPVGDPWRDVQGRIIERIAGSPWLGREFCRRIYGGKGPLWPDFYHCFADEHLLNVATKLGIYWARPDLMHHHENWARKDGATYEKDMPEFLRIANSPEHWKESKAIFDRLKAGGFAEADNLLP